jgi:hypothetical protein
MSVALLILVLAVMVIAGSCATNEIAYISKYYEIYGIWINPEYNFSHTPSKLIIHPNGRVDSYATDSTEISAAHFDIYITNKWTDSEGNIWYTYRLKMPDEAYYQYALAKIGDSGLTMETCSYPYEYPKKIERDWMYLYSIYYRH